MDLRRALDAVFRTLAKGKPPPEDALHALNDVLAAAHAERRLQPQAGGALAWRWERPDALEIAAWEIALAAAALLTDATAARASASAAIRRATGCSSTTCALASAAGAA